MNRNSYWTFPFALALMLGFSAAISAADLFFSASNNLRNMTAAQLPGSASLSNLVTNSISNSFAVTNSQNVYTWTGASQTIAKMDSSGNIINASLVTGMNTVGEIYAQGNDFWVVRNSPLSATKYDSNGNLLQTVNLSFMSTGTRAMAIDSQGFLYFTNSNQIWKYTSAGTWTGSFITIAGATDLFDIVIDSSDNLYVSVSNLNKIVKTNTSFLTPTDYVTGLSTPRGLALDPNNNLYVMNSFANQIRQYGSNGNLLQANYVFGILPSGAGTWISVPEPSTYALGTVTVLTLGFVARRKRKCQVA